MTAPPPEFRAVAGANQAFHHGRHRWLGLVARDGKLPGAALRVAILIWDLTNAERGYAWPSIPYMARELQLHRATVIRAIRALHDRGWVTIDRGNGRGRSNRYRIGFGIDGLDDESASTADETVASPQQSVATPQQKGRDNATLLSD
jgi:hypothetical protein